MFSAIFGNVIAMNAATGHLTMVVIRVKMTRETRHMATVIHCPGVQIGLVDSVGLV